MIKRDKTILNRAIKSFPLGLFDWDDSFISIILLSHDCHGLYSSDFNVCADRAKICFNMSSQRERKKCSFKNALVEKSDSLTRNKNGLVEGL